MLLTFSTSLRHFSCFRPTHNFSTYAILRSQSGGRNLSGFGLSIFKQSLPPMGRFRNNDVDSETLCKQASEDNCIGFQPQDHRAKDHRANPHKAKDEASEYDYFVHEQALLRVKGV